jgi:hypothetical protein
VSPVFGYGLVPWEFRDGARSSSVFTWLRPSRWQRCGSAGPVFRNGWLPLLIGALALWGAVRQPLPLLVSLVIVLAHSASAHKGYRFIYPAIPLILFCASLGSAELCHCWRPCGGDRPSKRRPSSSVVSG